MWYKIPGKKKYKGHFLTKLIDKWYIWGRHYICASKTNRSFSKTHKKLLQNGEKKIGTKLEKRENGMNGETLSG